MPFAVALLISGASGFVALSYEILWFRGISFVSGSSPAAFGLLLGYYLLGLALGAYLARRWCVEVGGPRRAGSDGLLVGGFILTASLVGYLVLPFLGWLSARADWLTTLPLVTFSAAMFGAVLPLVTHNAVAPDRYAGAGLSRIYLANIVGSAAGTVLTGFVLLDMCSIQTVSVILLLTGNLLAAAVLLRASVTLRAVGTHVLVIAAITAACIIPKHALFGRLYERLLYKTHYSPERRFAHVVENRAGVIAVTPDLTVIGGGVYDGVISTDLTHDRNQILRAYAVRAFQPEAREVLVIGLSTGAWVRVLSAMPGVARVTVIEINRGYLSLIRAFPQVAGILSDPKVTIVIDDGRRWLTRHPDRAFDLIVQNTTFHWRAHITNLLSAEYCELVRRHLAPGGVYYFNTTDSEEALKTAFTVFPYGFRLKNFAAVSDSPIGLDPARLRQELQEAVLQGQAVLDTTSPEGRARLEQIISEIQLDTGAAQRNALESRASIIARLASVPMITDDNMLSEWKRTILVPPWTPF